MSFSEIGSSAVRSYSTVLKSSSEFARIRRALQQMTVTAPFKPKDIWAIRVRLELGECIAARAIIMQQRTQRPVQF